MAQCNTLTTEEIYDAVVAKYGKLKAHNITSLASAVRDVINTKYGVTKKLSPALSAINTLVDGKTFAEIFKTKNSTKDLFAFTVEDEVYDSQESLQKALIEHGITSNFAEYLAKAFTNYRQFYDEKIAKEKAPFKNATWTLYPLSSLQSFVDGKQALPNSLLFTMMVTTNNFISSGMLNPLNSKQIAQLVYGDSNRYVPAKILAKFANVGSSRPSVIHSLGNEIYSLLNIKEESSKEESDDLLTVDSAKEVADRLKYALGLLATEIALKQKFKGNPLLTHTITHYENENEKKLTHHSLVINENASKLVKALDNFYLTAEKDLSVLFGNIPLTRTISQTPITRVVTQVKNSIHELNSRAVSTIRALQNAAWTKGSGFKVAQLLDRDTLRALHGYVDTSKTLVHIDELEGVEAKNAAIDAEIDVMLQHNELGLLERFYLQYKPMNTHRLTQLGPISPQNSKLHRALFVPFNATSKVSPKDTEMLNLFKAAVGQAFDEDIDKTDVSGVQKIFRELIKQAQAEGTDLNKAIEAYQTSNKEELQQALISLDKQYGAGPALMKGVAALSDYLNALNDKGKPRTFETDITIEADGITNGYAISLLQFAGGIFADGVFNWDKLAQVGITRSADAKTGSSVGQRGKNKVADAYTSLGQRVRSYFDENFGEFEEAFEEKYEESNGKEQLDALQVIGFDLSISSVVRKIAKSPFMVFNYGASIKSIAKNLSKETMALYRGKLVDIQTQYNAKKISLEEAVAQAQVIYDAGAVLGGAKTTAARLKLIIKGKGLNAIPLQTFNVERSTTQLYDTLFSLAMEEVLGNFPEFRNQYVKAAELLYFVFKQKYDEKLKELGVTNTELTDTQRTNIVRNELMAFYPQFKGAFTDPHNQQQIDTAIDLIKVAIIEGDVSVKVSIKDKSDPQVQTLSKDYAAPGVVAIIRAVQNIDSVLLSLALKQNYEISPIHDAVDVPLHSAKKVVEAYNKEYIHVNQKFGAFDQIISQLLDAIDGLDVTSKKAIAAKYRKEAFENTYSKAPISFKEALDRVISFNKQNNEAREALFEELNTEGTLVEQMYLPLPPVSFDEQTYISDYSYQHDSDLPSIYVQNKKFRQIQVLLKKMYPEISTRKVKDLVDQYGHTVIGRAVDSLVEYSDRAKLDTLPHEYAHIYVDLLESTTFMNETLTSLEEDHGISRGEAKERLVTFIGEYFVKNLNKERPKHTDTLEIIAGSLIKAKILDENKAHDLLRDTKVQAFQDWIRKFRRKLRDLGTKIKRVIYGKDVPTWRMTAIAERFRYGDSADAIRFSPMEGWKKVDPEVVFSTNPMGAEVIKQITSRMPNALLTGSTALAVGGNVYRKHLDSLHDLDFLIPPSLYKKSKTILAEIFQNNAGTETRITKVHEFPITKDNVRHWIATYIVPPEGTYIADVQRYGGYKRTRVTSYNIRKEGTGAVVGTYRADVKAKHSLSLRTELLDEHTTGEKAVLVDLMLDRSERTPLVYNSEALGKDILISQPASIFAAKNSITPGVTQAPRSKDVMDFNFFQPEEGSNLTNPLIFKEPQEVGSSPNAIGSWIQSVFENQSLALNANKIFSKLSQYNNQYVSKEAHQKETEHLQRVLRDLILRRVDNLAGVTISAGTVHGKTVGKYTVYESGKRKVSLGISSHAPRTYTEQSNQEVFVHESLHAIVSAVLRSNDPIVSKIQDIRNYVRNQLTVEDFLPKDDAGNIIYRNNKDAEYAEAQEQYNYFVGAYYLDSKGNKQESTLEEFVVGALTNKFLVNALENMKQPPKNQFWEGYRIVEKIGNLVATLIDKFMRNFRKEAVPENIMEDLFSIVEGIALAQEKQKQHLITKVAIEAKDKAFTAIAKGVDTGFKILSKDGKGNSFIPNAAHVLRHLPTTLQNVETQEAFAKAFRALPRNKQMQTVAQLMKEATVGTNNVFVDQLLVTSKHIIEAGRKHREISIIETIQKNFLSKFDDITQEEHAALYKVLLKADVSSLVADNSLNDIAELLRNPARLQQEIDNYKTFLNISNNPIYELYTSELAKFMITKEHSGSNIKLNASHIHSTYIKATNGTYDLAEVNRLDAYITLLALSRISFDTIKQALNVIDREQAEGFDNGITFLLKHHNDFKQESLKKAFDDNATQMIKGYAAEITDPYIDMIAAPASEAGELLKEGYIEVSGTRKLPGIDGEPISLYVNTNYVESTRVSGILSFTQRRSKGTTLFTILANKPENQITEQGEIVPNAAKINVMIENYAKHIQRIAKMEEKVGRPLSNDNKLTPLYDDKGNVVDYRVMLPFDKIEQHLKPDLRVDFTLGRMGMHLYDKVESIAVNDKAIKYLIKDYNLNYSTQKHEFIDLFSEEYYKDTYLQLTPELRNVIEQNAIINVGKGGKTSLSFPMRADHVIQFFGYKRKSLANIKLLKKVPGLPWRVAQLERMWMDIVALATKNIIIKEIAVPGFNILSNVLVLLTEGVHPAKLVKYMAVAWKEVENFKNDSRELMQVHLEVINLPLGTAKQQKLQDRHFKLQQRVKENPVYELVQEGMFTSISEDFELKEYDYFTKIQNALSNVIDKVPEPIQEGTRQLFITESTRTFQELHHFTQTMDFVARYALYQNEKSKKDFKKDKALEKIYNAFILYDRPMDPTLDYMNKMGGLLFVKFHLYIQKFLYNQTKRKPANVAFLLATQEMMGVDAPDIYDSSILLGNLMPPIGGPDKIAEEVAKFHALDMSGDITGLPIDPLD